MASHERCDTNSASPSGPNLPKTPKSVTQVAAAGFDTVLTGCHVVDVVSAMAWVSFFVAFRAHRNCALVYYGFYFLRAMFRPGIPLQLRGIRFWCLVHAVLDFMYFHVTTSPPALYFPVHVASHMALAWDLAKVAKRRVAGGRIMNGLFDFLVSLKFVFVIFTTLREMKIIEWVNPTFFEAIGLAHVPPLDDMGGAVIFMLLATCSSCQYGGYIFALHLISASLIGPCTPGEATCEKNVFNNMIWHQMTLLFAHQLLVHCGGKVASTTKHGSQRGAETKAIKATKPRKLLGLLFKSPETLVETKAPAHLKGAKAA